MLHQQTVDVAEPPLLDYPMPRVDPLLPPPLYDELRRRPPQKVRLPDGKVAWMLTRYQDVRAALVSPKMSSDFLLPGFPTLIQVPASPGAFSFFRMDPPDHTRLRRMVAPDFTPRRMREIRPAITAMADGLLDRMLEAGKPADLVRHFSLPLPSMVVANILGVPEEQYEPFQRYSETIVSSGVTPEQAGAALQGLSQMLDALATAKQAEPGDDLISRLVNDYEATGELTRFELVAMASLLLFAGHETTANQISLSVLHLLRNPEQLEAVRSDPEARHRAVDELLRICALMQHDLVRVAKEDVEIGGVHIAKGEGLITSQLAANFDPEAFPDPGRLDIGRDAHGQLALGYGLHVCIGGTLAKIELEIALERLFNRLPDLRLAASLEQIPFRHDMLIYGVHALPISW